MASLSKGFFSAGIVAAILNTRKSGEAFTASKISASVIDIFAWTSATDWNIGTI